MAALVVAECGAGYIYPRPVGPALRYANTYTRSNYAPDAITVLAEQPYTVDKAMAAVPLVVIPQDHLRVVQNAHISGISPTRPVVTVDAPSLPSKQEAMPAVRVVLQRPMYVNAVQSTIPFPAGFTIVHEGFRMPIPVGAVLAPVPNGAYLTAVRPIAIHVVYAVPTGPLPISYPFHSSFPIGGPLVINPGTGSFQTISSTSMAARPDAQKPIVSSGRPTVTVLDFPESVANPPTLVFQPPNLSEGSDLGNREPPQAVVPAGIVQSTAPLLIQSTFTNSKESEYLQQLKDEANRRPQQQHADFQSIIEALYK